MSGSEGPLGLKPLPNGRSRTRRNPAVPLAALSAREDAAQQNGTSGGGKPTFNSTDIAGMVSGMMSGNAGGMDPAALHAFMEQRRRQVAESPLARQAWRTLVC